MRTNNIALNASAPVTGVPLAYYDGEWLAVQITRNTVTGPLVMTIASVESGDSPTEARIEAAADVSDRIELSPTQLATQPEGSTWYWTLWSWDTSGRPDVQATGSVARKRAIKAAYSPAITLSLVSGTDKLVSGTDVLVITA